MFKEHCQTVHQGFHSASKFPNISWWVALFPVDQKYAIVLHNSTVTNINRVCLGAQAEGKTG